MKIISSKMSGLKIIKSKNYYDKRGYFREIFKNKIINRKKLIFWCTSNSKKNVLRGLHIQLKQKQDIYVSVLKGKIFDVVVDLRKGSKTFGKYAKIILSDKNFKSLYIPSGFAHGFCALEKENIVLYGISNYQSKKNEKGIIWNDKILNIKWPIKKPTLSLKDKKNITFKKFRDLY